MISVNGHIRNHHIMQQQLKFKEAEDTKGRESALIEFS